MLVYDYRAIGSSSVVYIFHKGIISSVLCGYEDIMYFINMYFLFSVKVHL